MNANGTPASGVDLRARRRSLGLSQEAVARTAMCSTGYVRLLEAGFAPGRSDVLPRVIAALNDIEAPDKGLDGKAAGDDGAYFHKD